MNIEEVKSLALPEVKLIRYKRFKDHRGYFCETMRKSDLDQIENGTIFKDLEFIQSNESFSKKGTVRGLHFQWDPVMGKLIRTIRGRMIDLVMDIRKGSKNFGKIIAIDLPTTSDEEFGFWVWVPVGFAHGNFFTEDTTIEYYCTGSYSPTTEAGISPLSSDINWSLCDPRLKEEFNEITKGASLLISDKDKGGYSLKSWSEKPESGKFTV